MYIFMSNSIERYLCIYDIYYWINGNCRWYLGKISNNVCIITRAIDVFTTMTQYLFPLGNYFNNTH